MKVSTLHERAAGQPVPFAELLRRHRDRSGLTQQQLADFATLSVRAIRDLESGRVRRPRRDSVGLLADALRLGEAERRQLHAAGGSPVDPRAPLAELPEPPAPPGALVGREAELQVLLDQVTVHGHRLVTVVGISGIGKTHLVLEAARVLRARGWRVGWHAPGGDPCRCGATRATRETRETRATPAVGSGFGGMAATGADVTDDLARAIGDRHELLVIDGDDPPGIGGVDVAELLRRCPGLRVVVTGLAPRHLPDERVLPLTATAVPAEAPDVDLDLDHARLSEVPSVALFLSHIRRSRPGFRLRDDNAQAVLRLCRWLDGVPRALEYAAGWCLVYPPELLLARAGRDSSLLSPPTGCTCHNLLRSLARSVDGLAERHRHVLAEVAHRPHWTLADLALLVPDPAAALHALLVQGLVRPVGAHRPEWFTVLQLVRLLHQSERTVAGPLTAAGRAA
ncbi:XRE family transcriptional regulator [Streptomyces longisporoflavus]|uniref:helix-turn-helix domain-containing protein n=1 Tax=Streptomyces longisporoflavus TaxID=28044 RepID=UPI001989AC88|nr:helix-turn-helix domain-containing protein [Streptomyces longisporoflavus]GGV68765.1 XRE family transcriptional regulator [Streptomyces longisporoflavus]